jgi:hypothetical protein
MHTCMCQRWSACICMGSRGVALKASMFLCRDECLTKAALQREGIVDRPPAKAKQLVGYVRTRGLKARGVVCDHHEQCILSFKGRLSWLNSGAKTSSHLHVYIV